MSVKSTGQESFSSRLPLSEEALALIKVSSPTPFPAVFLLKKTESKKKGNSMELGLRDRCINYSVLSRISRLFFRGEREPGVPSIHLVHWVEKKKDGKTIEGWLIKKLFLSD